MQKYISQPSDNLDGTYEVARYNEVSLKYEKLGTPYLYEEDAKNAASRLNEDYEKELAQQYEFEHQNELIDKYHNFALSSEIQKQNAAREFFNRFPYQRDVCEKILKDMDDR